MACVLSASAGVSVRLRFAKDAEFDSASAAGTVVAGGGVNGRVCFKREDGRTLRDVEESEAQAPLGASAS